MADDTERIERLEQRVDFLIRYLGIDPANVAAGIATGAGVGPYGPVPTSLGTMAPDDFPPALYDAIRTGKKIDAIKIYRSVTGASLAEAKSAVESMAQGM